MTSLCPCVPVVELSFSYYFELILSPTMAASSTSLLVLSSMSTCLDDNKVMSSAKSRASKTEVSFHRMPVLLPSVVLFMTQSIDSKKRKPDMVHPCFNPDWT